MAPLITHHLTAAACTSPSSARSSPPHPLRVSSSATSSCTPPQRIGGEHRDLQKVAKLFAGLEADRVSGRDLHFDACLRIAPDPLLALLDLEHAEAAQLDALAARQCVAQSFDDRIDRLRRFHP